MKYLQLLLKPSLMVQKAYYILFNFIGKLPAQKNLVIFESYLGKQFSDNPRAIYEYMREHHPEFKLIWSIDKRYEANFQQAGISMVQRFSIKWLWYMPRAKYWVNNSRMPYWIQKPDHTIYLQTWHGTPLKKLAADMDEVHMPGTTTEKYKENFIKETKNWDYLISPNTYSTEIFQRAFRFQHQILETGYPRNDELINRSNPEHILSIKEKLGIPQDKKVILYAPTWRDDEYYAKGKYKFTIKMDMDQLQEALQEDYVILFRMHYLIASRMDLSDFNGFAYDVSNIQDIRELYLISDVLMTDYSSVIFDYLCLKRPILLYTYDIDTYRDKLRGFYFDIEKDSPGPLVKTTEEIIQTIKQFESEGFRPSKAVMRFHRKFCDLEKGKSTERVVKSVFAERAAK